MKFLPRLLIMLLLSSQTLLGQQLPKTLLWKITGKDGHHTSYLYGTMHLTDDRVFNLGDSLYGAISSSDGFAMELDPNALTTLLIDEVQKRIVNAKNIKDLLSESEYRTYGPRLARKLGKPLENITSEDILREKNKWITEAYRRGSMPTFLDTYLYDIARRQNKWTGGVEDVDDQRGLLDDVVDENDIRSLVSDDPDSLGRHSSPAPLVSMIDLYADQNLSAIDSMESHLANRDVILIKRNKKMAARMDSLSGVRSMVFAVGAAHLPGEEGLITLLRKRGFDVTPVISDRTIKAADYKVKELPRTWMKIRDDDSLYQVSMPGKPGDIELYGVMKMKMYFDLFEGIGYFSTAFQSIYGDKAADSLMDSWAKLLFKGKGKRDYKSVGIFDAKGRIYEGTDLDGYKKAMILIKDNMIYLVYAMSLQPTAKNNHNADQFIQSFQMLKRTQTISDTSTLAGIPHIDTAMAFRVATPFPAKPYNTPSKSEGWSSASYVSADVQNGIYFIFGVNSVSRGHYIPNDSTYFVELKKAALKNIGTMFADTSWSTGDVRITEFRAGMKQSGYEMRCRYIGRGNRWYALVAMCPTNMDRAPVVEQFFSSFKFLDYPAHHWQAAMTPDSVFTGWCPAPIAIDSASESASVTLVDAQYSSFDSSRSMGYSVTALHLDPYFWSTSDSAFWAARIKKDVSFDDTLIEKRPVKNGDVSGWDWLEREHGSHNYVRRRALLYGDELYYLFAAGLRDELESDNANRFFDDFRLLHPAPPCTIFQSKAQRLLEDLQSQDSVKAATARLSLYSAPFTVKDLPLMHEALLKWRPGDLAWESQGLVQHIQDLHDSSSFIFAVDHYPAVPDSNSRLKNDLLCLMANFPDSMHFATLTRLLDARPPAELSSSLIWKLGSQPKLMAVFLPHLLPLLEDSAIRPSLVMLIADMIDSGSLEGKALAPYRNTLLAYADTRIRWLADSTNGDYKDKYLIELIALFNDVRSNALLQKFLVVKDNFIRQRALEALLQNKQAPAASAVQALAADKSYRLAAYRALKKYNRLSLLPAVYRTPKAIGAALVKDIGEEDETDIDSITFVISLVRDIGHGPQRFFFYRVSNGESFLACAGPFNVNPPVTAGWYNDDGKAFVLYDKEYDPDQQQEQIEDLLAKFKED